MPRIPALALWLTALAAPAAAAVSADDILAEAKADCASFGNGTLTVPPEAVTQVELTGEGAPETVIDWGKLRCSTAAGLWGGSGGSSLSVLAGGQRWDFLTNDWQVVQMGGPVLLLWLHGSECNGAGAQRCIEALTWGGEGFLSVRPAAGGEDDPPAGDQPADGAAGKDGTEGKGAAP